MNETHTHKKRELERAKISFRVFHQIQTGRLLFFKLYLFIFFFLQTKKSILNSFNRVNIRIHLQNRSI